MVSLSEHDGTPAPWLEFAAGSKIQGAVFTLLSKRSKDDGCEAAHEEQTRRISQQRKDISIVPSDKKLDEKDDSTATSTEQPEVIGRHLGGGHVQSVHAGRALKKTQDNRKRLEVSRQPKHLVTGDSAPGSSQTSRRAFVHRPNHPRSHGGQTFNEGPASVGEKESDKDGFIVM
ncbi:hypothetical protein MRX96_057426 [Rhipicephalus microplus]